MSEIPIGARVLIAAEGRCEGQVGIVKDVLDEDLGTMLETQYLVETESGYDQFLAEDLISL